MRASFTRGKIPVFAQITRCACPTPDSSVYHCSITRLMEDNSIQLKVTALLAPPLPQHMRPYAERTRLLMSASLSACAHLQFADKLYAWPCMKFRSALVIARLHGVCYSRQVFAGPDNNCITHAAGQ